MRHLALGAWRQGMGVHFFPTGLTVRVVRPCRQVDCVTRFAIGESRHSCPRTSIFGRTVIPHEYFPIPKRRSLRVARSMLALRLLRQPYRTGLRQRRGQGLGTMRSGEVEKTRRPGNIMPTITAARLYSLFASCRWRFLTGLGINVVRGTTHPLGGPPNEPGQP